MTAACVQRGFDYVSDESLCIDVDSARVIRYPKPLGLSRWSRDQLGVEDATLALPAAGREGMATPQDLGGTVASEPIELAHIVLPRYGMGRLGFEMAPSHTAMAALLEFSFNHFKHGKRSFTLAAELANRVEVWRLDYDNVGAAAQLVESRLG